MNAFRCTPDRALDRQYLRTCAIYRALKRKWIGKAKALELQNKPYPNSTRRPPADYLTGTIGLWYQHPIKDMRP